MNEPKVNVLVYNNTIYRFSDYNSNPDAEFDSVNEKYKRSMPVGHGGDDAGCQWVNNIFGFNVAPFPGQTYVANLSSINPAEVFNDRSGKPIDKLESCGNTTLRSSPVHRRSGQVYLWKELPKVPG